MKKMQPLVALLALSMACVAQAADNGFYLGAGIGSSKFDVDDALDDTDLGMKLIAGVRLLDSFALEASYVDFGKATMPSGASCIALVGVNCPAASDVQGTALGAFALGFLHFPLLDIFGKVGMSRVESQLHTPDVPDFNTTDNSTDVAWGLGAQVHFGSFAVRGEFEQYQLFKQDQHLLSLSFLYTFL